MRLHLVSHTHWDREWYQTFQQFRYKLVHLVDELLHILRTDPDYQYFTLDGQTIVLEDYLEIRPEKEAEIRELVQSGRLLIGPWYILPDEFLVSPEATVRNLLEGARTSRRFGGKMNIGYLPDPFGHIGQMPQILKGFGIEAACLQRGLDEEPPELWWQAPDSSQVFVAYLRDGYGNASGLPVSDPDLFTSEVRRLRASLLAFSHAGREGATPGGHLLLMQGTDHMEPLPETPRAIARANEILAETQIVHSCLPDYLAGIQGYLDQSGLEIPVVQGELRSSRRFHLLPGVLSSRMWIKQRNFQCETLLEKWAEPFSVWAHLAGGPPENEKTARDLPVRMRESEGFLRHAWRLLMECHPHDSICGCSIDQVYEEMRPRFDQVEQLGEEITRHSLTALAQAVDTRRMDVDHALAVVVFNPSSSLRTDAVRVAFPADWDQPGFAVIDDGGRRISHQVLGKGSRQLMDAALDKDGMRSLVNTAQNGRVGSLAVRGIRIHGQGDQVFIDVQVSEMLEPDQNAIRHAWFEIGRHLDDPAVRTFSVRARTETETEALFTAEDVPGPGWKTYWIIPDEAPAPEEVAGSAVESQETISIANENLFLAFDPEAGWFNLTDTRTGLVFSGLNRFVDGGDCGDLYNYSPPEHDEWIDSITVEEVKVERGPVRQSITATLRLEIPRALSPDRSRRSPERVTLSIESTASLVWGLDRVDFSTRVTNRAHDHRLRVHFPVPFKANTADYDGHFEVVQRSTALREYNNTWIEPPRPEAPQRFFTSVHTEGAGLVLANRGLPEIEILQTETGNSEIGLTLLRCTGWLSRDDFSSRKGHAGPGLATPGAQEQGEHSFEYAVVPTSKGSRMEAYQQGRAFSVPLRAEAARLQPGSLPATGSFVKVEPAEIEVSTVKYWDNSTDGSPGWIVRGYNQSEREVRVDITPFQPFPLASRVNLAEERLQDLEVAESGRVSFPARGCEIFTILFWED